LITASACPGRNGIRKGGGPVIPVLIINLNEDSARYERLLAQIAPFPFLQPQRVEGIRGSLLPDAATLALTRNKWSPSHKGTLGCFLSHVRAWEVVAASDWAFGLIVEDDVSVDGAPLLAGIRLPRDVDIVFCNDRSCYPDGSPADGIRFRPFLPVLAHLIATRKPVGGDGYLLTPSGARKLIDFVGGDSFFSHVDLRMAAYCIDRADAQPFRENEWLPVRNIAGMRMMYPEAHRLRASSLAPPIVRHGTEQSRRAREDRLGVSEKAQ
jgi:hypothetical protein